MMISSYKDIIKNKYLDASYPNKVDKKGIHLMSYGGSQKLLVDIGNVIAGVRRIWQLKIMMI